jgi:ribosomal peptide maturation radical SAM protein 1
MYSELLFPEQGERARDFMTKTRRREGKNLPKAFDLQKALALLHDHLVVFIQNIASKPYDLVGFSVCFHQLLSSLAAAARLKACRPQLPVVFGGSSCAGDLGLTLAKNFSQIDYLVSGEGEMPLLALCNFLGGRSKRPPSMVTLTKKTGKKSCPDRQLADLRTLPIPDYHDYFAQMQEVFHRRPFIPQMPIEFSRGCWWFKCTFCNLNLQWSGFRKKKPNQVHREVTTLANRHGSLDFTFTDNSLPQEESLLFFDQLAKLQRDYKFFAEIRTLGQRRRQDHLFGTYCRGGLSTIQMGIESLSNSLLIKMKKGTTVMNNIAAMRDALANGLLLKGNLITEFPGSTEKEVAETLANLNFVLPFPPLSSSAFFLGHDSPIARNPRKFQIRYIKHHPASFHIFPRAILNQLLLPVMGYSGDHLLQQKMWRPVVEKIKLWQEFHRHRTAAAATQHALSYRDGGAYIIIRQEKPGEATLYHRLRGQSRAIYLFCADIRTRDEIAERFPSIREKRLVAFLDELIAKHIMYREDDRFLSLAVPFAKGCSL